MTLREKYARTFAGFTDGPVEIAAQVESRQRLDGDVLDRIVRRIDLAGDARVERGLLRHGP